MTADGTFTTTESGNGIIFANKISDQRDKENWKGVIFEGKSGKVYGDSVTPTENFTIEENQTLTISSDSKLIVADGITITNQQGLSTMRMAVRFTLMTAAL